MSTIVPSARLSNRLDSHQVENNGCLSPDGPESFDPEQDERLPTAPSYGKHDDSGFIDRLYNDYHCKVILSQGTYCD
jgi:hypothetical protein